MLSLRPYQQAAIDAIYGYFAERAGNPLVVHPDRRRQIARHGVLRRGRAARLARPAHPYRDARPRADRAEPCRADRPLAGRAGRHLLGRARPARSRRPHPVCRHPVDPPPGIRRPAVRPRADRRGAPDPRRVEHHVPPLPRHADADQPGAQGDRLHGDALPARQRHAARGQGRALHRHRLRGLRPRADRRRLSLSAGQQGGVDPARRDRRRHARRRVRRARAAGRGRPARDHRGGDRRGGGARRATGAPGSPSAPGSSTRRTSPSPSAPAASRPRRSSGTRRRPSATASSPGSSAARSGRSPRWAC